MDRNFKDKNILLVEDNPDDVVLTIRAFNKSNLVNRVIVARDGAEAIDILLGNGGNQNQEKELPVLVLLDLNLPKISGLEVLKRIRGNERTRMLPVVILTSSTEERDIIKGYQLGTNSYIRKPVDFNNFIEVIEHMGLYWLVLNTPPPM